MEVVVMLQFSFFHSRPIIPYMQQIPPDVVLASAR